MCTSIRTALLSDESGSRPSVRRMVRATPVGITRHSTFSAAAIRPVARCRPLLLLLHKGVLSTNKLAIASVLRTTIFNVNRHVRPPLLNKVDDYSNRSWKVPLDSLTISPAIEAFHREHDALLAVPKTLKQPQMAASLCRIFAHRLARLHCAWSEPGGWWKRGLRGVHARCSQSICTWPGCE